MLLQNEADSFKLFIVQIVIALVATLYCAVFTALIALALKYTMGWRISGADETAGIDTTQHAEVAYSYTDENEQEFEEVTDFDEAQDAAHR